MLSFLRRSRRKPAWHGPPRARLQLEALESRYCLTAPSLSLSATVLPGHMVQLSGMLTDSNPAGASVAFSGAVSGGTSTDSYGHYAYVTSSAVLGTVSAVAVDRQGQTSNTAQATISVTPPTITLVVSSYGSGRYVTLSGAVTDIDANGRTVTFTGVVTGSVNASAGGSFSYTAQASGQGTVSVSTVDLWGQRSNIASVTVADDAPVINGFQAVEGSNFLWTFSGTVNDESPAGMTVTFGGLPSLQGKTAICGYDGSFSLTVQLQQGEQGTATAQTTDAWGQLSNVASTNVYQTTPVSLLIMAAHQKSSDPAFGFLY